MASLRGLVVDWLSVEVTEATSHSAGRSCLLLMVVTGSKTQRESKHQFPSVFKPQLVSHVLWSQWPKRIRLKSVWEGDGTPEAVHEGKWIGGHNCKQSTTLIGFVCLVGVLVLFLSVIVVSLFFRAFFKFLCNTICQSVLSWCPDFELQVESPSPLWG